MTALIYFDLFNELGGHHSTEMWILFSLRALLSSIGILLNLLLLFATFKARKLRSICNWLIALDTSMLTLFQLNPLITFLIAATGINFVQLSVCFYLQALPLFGILMAFQVMLLIGIERLANVLFPFWSHQLNSKLLHLGLLLFSFGGCCYLIWLDYLECYSKINPVFCQISDITSLGIFYQISLTRTLILHGLLLTVYVTLWVLVKYKKLQSSQTFSKNLFKSLLGLAMVELFGWLPSIFFGKLLQWLQLNPLQTAYASAIYACISPVTASANLPMLFAFSRTYRQAIFEVFAQFGFKKSGNGMAWTTSGIRQLRTQQLNQQQSSQGNGVVIAGTRLNNRLNN